jgi:hypothetical protein
VEEDWVLLGPGGQHTHHSSLKKKQYKYNANDKRLQSISISGLTEMIEKEDPMS